MAKWAHCSPPTSFLKVLGLAPTTAPGARPFRASKSPASADHQVICLLPPSRPRTYTSLYL